MATKIPSPDQAIYEWESRATLAPLTSSEKNSVHLLSVLVSRLSMPVYFYILCNNYSWVY